MGAGAPTVLSDWFMHADACKPQPGCGWCRGAMRAQMRRLSGCADSKGGGARAACSARGDAEMNAGRRVTRRRGNQVDEGVAQGHEQAERQVRRSYSSPPRGGANSTPPTPILRWAARCACGLRPAPRALLRVGRAAPRPPGLRPLRPRGRGLPAFVFFKWVFGKRSASGRRRGPCGQGGAAVGACASTRSVVHMCPRRASLSSRQHKQGGGAPRF